MVQRACLGLDGHLVSHLIDTPPHVHSRHPHFSLFKKKKKNDALKLASAQCSQIIFPWAKRPCCALKELNDEKHGKIWLSICSTFAAGHRISYVATGQVCKHNPYETLNCLTLHKSSRYFIFILTKQNRTAKALMTILRNQHQPNLICWQHYILVLNADENLSSKVISWPSLLMLTL